MNREGHLIKSTLILGIGNVIPKLSTVLILPILTSNLTKEDYGTYELLSILIVILLPSITLQIQTAAFRFLIDDRNDRKSIVRTITNVIVFTVPISILVSLPCFFFVPFNRTLRLLIIVYLLAEFYTDTFRQFARGLGMNQVYSVNVMIQSLSMVLLIIALVWLLRMGFIGAIIALAGSSILSLVVIIPSVNLFSYFNFKTIEWPYIKRMIAYSWPMVPNTLSMWIMWASDRVIVTAFMGLTANAIYAAANKIPSILTVAQTSFTMAWQENASIVSGDKDANNYYSEMFHTVFDFMAGTLGLLISFTPLLFVILIRGDYNDAYRQMPMLFIGMFLYSICAYLGGIYVALKATKSVGITTLSAAVANLLLDVCLIGFIGLYAASLSTLISYLLLLVFRMIDIRKLVALKYKWKHLLVVISVLVLEAVICSFRLLVLDYVNMTIGVITFIILNRNMISKVMYRITSHSSGVGE